MLNSFIKKNNLVISFSIFLLFIINLIDTKSLSHKIFHDDSFYYFEIAKNFIDGYGFTFDNLSKTNGFHLLWMIFLIFFGFIFNSFLEIAQISIWIQTLLLTLSFKSINNVYRNNFTQKAINISVHLMFLPFFLNGMETSLAIFLFNLLIIKLYITKNYSKLAILVFLILLTRYDAVIILFLIFLIHLYKTKKYFYLKQFLLGFTAFLLVIVSFNYFLGFGIDNLSTSSEVKNYWFELEYQAHLETCDIQNFNCSLYFIKNKIEFLPIYITNVSKLLYSFINYSSAYNASGEIPVNRLLPFLAVVSPFFIFNILKRKEINRFDLNSLWVISAIHLIVLSLSSIIWLVFDWYNYFFISVLMFTIIEIFNNKSIVIVFPIFIFIIINSYIYLSSPQSQWSKAYSATVNHMNTYENVVIGTWAAGHIGYYSDNPVINLEGLVSSSEVIKLNKSDNLSDYLLENVNYVVTNFDPYKAPGDPKWFYALRINPLIELEEKLELVETIQSNDDSYIMYIFRINNSTKDDL